MNPLKQLEEYGQSVWLDYIRRNLLTGGDLKRLVQEDGLKGLTSNPAIFQKAITGSSDYDATLQELAAGPAMDAKQMFEYLALADIRDAADQMRPVFEATQGRDGYVSMEVSPRLAYDREGTCREARRLWQEIDRENVMIKVPATAEGIPAIEILVAEGININVTLLFSIPYYEQAVDAYITGLERLRDGGGDPGRVASVASLFVSRVDSAVDARVRERLENGAQEGEVALLRKVEGQVAIANARLAYQRYKDLFSGARWEALASQGARTQRLLWASTGVKDPAMRDVRYIEELIGPDTVNTVPPATMDAFRDHGVPRNSIEENLDDAREVIEILDEIAISLESVTDELLSNGVSKFVDAFDKLLAAVESASEETMKRKSVRQRYSLPGELAGDLEGVLSDWADGDKVRRLWARDAWLWTGKDEPRWMDWLGVTGEQLEHLGNLRRISRGVEGHYFHHIILLGMGGSSMAPEVIRMSFGKQENYPDLVVLDSTDPAQIRAVEARVDLKRSLFVVSSKSGSTLEPNILMEYFLARMKEVLGESVAAQHFVAITDPGSSLEKLAGEKSFRRVFHGMPGIGGRYSALSNFGMVPAAGMGVDVGRLLDEAEEMVESCAACVPARENPGVVLGAILGVCANRGRDKVTLIASPGVAALGAWLEQLLAESTGKEGKALIPVDGETAGEDAVYGNDRVFVYVRLNSEADSGQDEALDRLEQAGQAVVRICMDDVYDLGKEFFRWEIATAVAGSVLGINPFDQPDVEASKLASRRLTDEFEATGALPQESPFATGQGLILYTDSSNADALTELAGEGASVGDYLKAHVGRLGAGDYCALLAYLNRDADHTGILQEIRHRVRDSRRVATCLGFGPRFLHSTGQAYKGGPDTGVFLQITCDEAADLAIPGHKFTFGVAKAAQARGDFEVLAERGRRALRVHLGADTMAGLASLRDLLGAAPNQS